MNIEEIKIEDTADANYVIRKFFNNQFKGITIHQLEQLVLTVYNMGKNSGASSELPPELNETEPENINPFKINDRAKALEDVEIGHSGEFIKANTVGTITSVKGDTVSYLFELDEDGEMIEASVLFDKLEKIN